MRLRVVAALAGLAVLVPASASAVESAPAVSKTQAKKLAKAGVLTKKDLKGYEADPSSYGPSDLAAENAFYKCLGTKAPSYVARNAGVSYSKGALTIDSSADVVASVAAAKKDFKGLKSSKAAGCVKKRFVSIFKSSGITPHSLKATRATVKVAGADETVAFRVRGDLQSTDILFRYDSYLVLFHVGQTEMAVSPSTFDGQAPSLKNAAKLAGVVAKRVRAS